MSITRRQFLLTTTGVRVGLSLPSFHQRALSLPENLGNGIEHEKPFYMHFKAGYKADVNGMHINCHNVVVISADCYATARRKAHSVFDASQVTVIGKQPNMKPFRGGLVYVNV